MHQFQLADWVLNNQNEVPFFNGMLNNTHKCTSPPLKPPPPPPPQDCTTKT